MITADHARTSRIALSLLALALVVSGCGDDAPVASVDAAVVIDMPPVDFGTDAFAAPDLGTCRDDDGDGFTAGASPCGSDCDDSDASRYPGADEICDGDDEDCNESTLGPDGDGDGFSSTACCNGLGTCGTDCDDTRATVNDTALETCDGVDNDCDGVVDDGLTPIAYAADCDLDGFGDATAPGMAACTMPVLPPAACAGGEWVLNATDCDDGDASVHRGATDFCGDTVDSDCDPTTAGRPTMWFRDADDDGFYGAPVDEITSCTRPPGHARTPGDCNDADPTTRPGAAERCDNRDNDCDALVDDGADGSCAGVLPNATSVCRAGACVVDTCFSSFGDCNGTAMDGCETNVSSAVVNCGSCGFACAARPSSVATCVASRCEYTCAAGFQDCGASPGCESVSAADAANCGTCGNVCPGAVNASATCAASTCGYACAPGFRDCGASPGCESASATDLANCGSCGNVCSGAMNASATCTASTCGYTCGAGFGDCDASRLNGCEAAFATDATRCGSCANDCTAAANVVIGMCSASTCVLGPMSCATGFSHCDASVVNGCERPTTADVNNCGGCGTVCGGSQVCVASMCSDPRVLAVYPSTAVAGQRVRVHGIFAPGATSLQFPGVAGTTTTTRVGDGVLEAVVPATATIGVIRLAGGTNGPRFRRASFGLGMGAFRRAYEQTTYGRPWPQLATARSRAASFQSLQWLYVLGGGDGTGTDYATVERSLINADGTLSEFAGTAPLTTGRDGAATVRVGQTLYVVGGRGLSTIERASIAADGTLGPFSDTGVSLTLARDGHAALVVGSFVYVVGGSVRAVERASIAADGTLGAFATVASSALSVVRRDAAVAVVGPHLFVFGGTTDGTTALASAERAPIDGSGLVGAFVSAGIMRNPRFGFRALHLASSSETASTVYLVGGRDVAADPAERVTINLGTGATVYADTTTNLQVGRRSPVVEVVSNHVYVLGGSVSGTPNRTVERATINTTGVLAQGVSTTAQVPGANGAIFVIGRRIYRGLAGSYTSGPISSAPVAEDGSIGAFVPDVGYSWAPNSDGGATVAGGRVWSIGGHSPNYCTAAQVVYYHAHAPSGFPLTSSAEAPTLAITQGNPAHLVLGGFVYVFGGVTGTCADFRASAGIQRSPIATPAWADTGISLPSAPGSFTNTLVIDDVATLFPGQVNIGSIQRATWNGTTLGAFTATNGVVDGGRDNVFALAVVGDNVYAMGGSGGAAGNTCSVASLPLPPGPAATGAFTVTLSPCFAEPRLYYARTLVIDNDVVVFGGYATPSTVAQYIERLEMR